MPIAIVLLAMHFAPPSQLDDDRSRKVAAMGDTYVGVIVSEDKSNTELVLNIKPCDSQPDIVVFRKKYTKDGAASVSCKDGTSKALTQVTQKANASLSKD